MPVSLEGQVVLVVGASSGIGRAAAVLFAREGARVIASARRGDRLRGLQDELSKEGRTIAIAPADASNPAEAQQLVERATAQFGPVDILLHAAGTNTLERAMKRLTPDVWNMMIAANLNAAFYVTYALLPAMRERGSGHLIYIS